MMKQKESEKHDRIVSAAAGLFAKQGYKKTTIDEIVEEAGISKGLFYHYFSNKKELYLYLYNTYVEILSNTIREKVDLSETDFLKRLKQIAHIRIDFVKQYPSLWDFLFAAYFENHKDVALEIKEKNEALLQQSFESSAANIDWSKLDKHLSSDKAIELVTWIAEGFVRKIATAPTPIAEIKSQFDEYLSYLQNGIYGGK